MSGSTVDKNHDPLVSDSESQYTARVISFIAQELMWYNLCRRTAKSQVQTLLSLKVSAEDYEKKKWGILFDFLDINRDGLFDTEEMMAFPRKLINNGKVKEGEVLGRVYTEAWGRICEAIGLPRNNPSLTKANFIAGYMTFSKTKWFAETFVPTIARIYFESLDRNDDGSISLDEWRVFNNNRGMTDDAVIKSTFNRLDGDGDGSISPEEIKHGVTQFNLGEDPDDDYSFLYSIK